MGIPKLIYCADGAPKLARAAVDAGWLYGARLPAKVYQPVHFADQDWKAPNRRAYMRALELHRPAMATVIDWEYPEQLPEVLGWAEEAAEMVGESVVIVPKVPGEVYRVPGSVGGKPAILGFSVPTSYGGSCCWLGEFGRRPVHLLGGSPQAQMRLACYLNVVSADGNMAGQQARRGRFWRRRKGSRGHWVQLSEVGDMRTREADLEAFRRSLEEIREAWRQ